MLEFFKHIQNVFDIHNTCTQYRGETVEFNQLCIDFIVNFRPITEIIYTQI